MYVFDFKCHQTSDGPVRSADLRGCPVGPHTSSVRSIAASPRNQQMYLTNITVLGLPVARQGK